jgi:YidC/Oxa1 family membrane protein insertase
MSPELQQIQAKYKDKRDQVYMMNMQAETKEVYAKYGTSPSGGCLTMLIQLPIMFALYRVIYKIPGYITKIGDICREVVEKITGSINWYGNINGILDVDKAISTDKFVDKIYNLSSDQWIALQERFPNLELADAADKIQGYNNFFGISLIDNPGWKLSWALLIPILAGLTQWLSAKLMENKKKPTIGGPAQEQPGANSMKVMNTIMPIISAVFCVSFPACMGLYWIASSVVQIVIQIFINKSMDGMEVDQIVKMNIEKTNAKRAKKGLPPLKISNVTSNYVEQVKKMEAREARKDEREAEIKKSTSYYNASGKPASLKDKANMVKMFNERNNNNNK